MTEATASMKNTKNEMLDIIDRLQNDLEEKEKAKLNPEKVKEENRKAETIKKADQAVDSDLSTQIHSLKLSISKELTSLADTIQAEAEKYDNLNRAIELKKGELETLYSIEAEAAKLAAILEAQYQTREQFDLEMVDKREQLDSDLAARQEKLETMIVETKAAWEKEKSTYMEALAEEKEKNEKERTREQEEYEYQLNRTRELDRNKLDDERKQVEQELANKKNSFELFRQEKTTELEEREKQVAEREQLMDKLQRQVEAFPAELKKSIDSAVKAAEKQAADLFAQQETILNKTFEGEKNVLKTRITALDSLVKDQAKQIEKLHDQQEKAYQQVQDIAGKAVTGAAERPQNITVRAAESD